MIQTIGHSLSMISLFISISILLCFKWVWLSSISYLTHCFFFISNMLYHETFCSESCETQETLFTSILWSLYSFEVRVHGPESWTYWRSRTQFPGMTFFLQQASLNRIYNPYREAADINEDQTLLENIGVSMEFCDGSLTITVSITVDEIMGNLGNLKSSRSSFSNSESH